VSADPSTRHRLVSILLSLAVIGVGAQVASGASLPTEERIRKHGGKKIRVAKRAARRA
jgi:hypothetical protein